ncbi:hypothetical protein RV07_GL003243 [Enterococcus malodoratus]|nr:hypothetical protein RV07_GL003243 [Enterococcus malodoratus]
MKKEFVMLSFSYWQFFVRSVKVNQTKENYFLVFQGGK